MKIQRKADWSNWSISLYQEVDGANEFIANIEFEVGPQGPIDGCYGTEIRESYCRMVRDWLDHGMVPARAEYYADPKQPWKGYK